VSRRLFSLAGLLAISLLFACGNGPSKPASSAPRTSSVALSPTEISRFVWRTDIDRTLCPTAPPIADASGNIYIPTWFRGPTYIGETYISGNSSQAIIVRVSPSGKANILEVPRLSPAREEIEELAWLKPPKGSEGGEGGLVALRESRRWSKYVSLTEAMSEEWTLPKNGHAILVGGHAIAMLDDGEDPILSVWLKGHLLWRMRTGKGDIIPSGASQLVYNGKDRLAVLTSGNSASVSVLTREGKLIFQAQLERLERPVVQVATMQFDAEGGLWVLGHATRYELVDNELHRVAKTSPHLMGDYVLDAWIAHYDKNGHRLLDKVFPAEYRMVLIGAAEHGGILYSLLSTDGVMDPLDKRAGMQPPVFATYLVGLDKRGEIVYRAELDASRAAGGYIVPLPDGFFVMLVKRRYDKKRSSAYEDCEGIRYLMQKR